MRVVLEQESREAVDSLFLEDTENLTKPCVTSSNSKTGPALKVDEIRDVKRCFPPCSTLILCQHGRCSRKPNHEAPIQTLGILLLPLQVLNLIT